MNMNMEIGSIEDIDPNDWHKNRPTFIGYYAQIIERIRTEIQPQAKFFFVTMLCHDEETVRYERRKKHAEAICSLTEYFENSYVIDLYQYGPKYSEEYKEKFALYGHFNPMGYIYAAKMIDSYIDYIIRQNPDDFRRVPFIGKGLK